MSYPTASTAPSASSPVNGTKPPPVWISYPIDELVSNDLRYQFRSASTITLDNAVNPTMARERWSGSGIDFDAILPALQLSAKLIDLPQSRRYYSANVLSLPRQVNYTDKAGTYMAIFRKPLPLSRADDAALAKFWQDFAPSLKFALADFPSSSAQAATARDKTSPVRRDVFPVTSLGHGSTIKISRSMYHGLIEAVACYRTNPHSTYNQERLFTEYFGLAKILAHELAHAVAMGRWPDSRTLCMPFEDQLFCEDGFLWESCVFGGATVNTHGPWAWFTDYPSGAIVEQYVRKRGIDVAVTGSLQTVLSADHANSWVILPCFIRALFQKSFWRQTLPRLGEEAAWRFPKLLGHRLAPTGLGTCEKCYCQSCFRMKEFFMRSYARGNKPIKKEGRYESALADLEKARMAAEMHREGVQQWQVFSQNGHARSARRTQFPAAGAAFIPTENDTSRHSIPPAACIHGTWAEWSGPKSAEDSRKLESFGVPSGFVSHTDGSVVVVESLNAVVAWDRTRASAGAFGC